MSYVEREPRTIWQGTMSYDFTLTLDACEHCKRPGECVWEGQITYNLGPMWRAAGLPFSDDAVEGMLASDIGQAVEEGLAILRADPPRFQALNAPNGWGTYEDLCGFLDGMLEACRKFPTARFAR